MSFGQLEWLRRKIQTGLDGLSRSVTDAKDTLWNHISGNTTNVVNNVVASKNDILARMNQGVVTLNSFPKITGALYNEIARNISVHYDGAGYCFIYCGSAWSYASISVNGVHIGTPYTPNGLVFGPIPFSSSIDVSNTTSNGTVNASFIFVQPPPLIGWLKQILPTFERRYLHGLVAV